VGEQQAHERTRAQELRLGGDAHAVPAAAVEDLLAPQPEPGHEVLQIRHRRRSAPEHRRVERAATGGEQAERDEAAADLEAPVGDVLVRHPIAGQMQRRAEQERKGTRADEGADRASGRDVQRDDHTPIIAYAPRR
jgi:hypothetical protein